MDEPTEPTAPTARPRGRVPQAAKPPKGTRRTRAEAPAASIPPPAGPFAPDPSAATPLNPFAPVADSPAAAILGGAPGSVGADRASKATEELPLVTSLGLGVGVALVAGIAWFLLTYTTHRLIAYAGAGIGVAIGTAFEHKAMRRPWLPRSVLSLGVATTTLFLAQYFVVRQLAIDSLSGRGPVRAEDIPIFVAPDVMLDAVGSMFTSTPMTYAVWAVALLFAGLLPGSRQRTLNKAARQSARS